jgi:DNA polymerase (family 10)
VDNKQVAAVLDEIAVLLELSGENPFKARSYSNVARAVEQLDFEIETLVAGKRLREVKGVGEGLEQKLGELLTTGRLGYLENLRKKFPATLFDLFRIPGLGAKRIQTIYKDLGIQTLDELEAACNSDRLAQIKGFGEKTQENILKGIAFAREHHGLFLFDVALSAAETLRGHLAATAAAQRIEIAGSIRRRKEVVRDIDILVSSKTAAPLMEAFVTAPGVASVTAHGETKSSVVLATGIAADLRVVSDEQFPYALNYFTGSKDHNVAVRARAKDLGLKLNEYGLFREDGTSIPCKDEAAIYKALHLPYIPPELRENMGELDAAEIPRLVDRDDLIGMFHCHTSYSDGTCTVEQLARACIERGYKYLTVTDHSQSAGYAGGLTPAALNKQMKEIDAVNKRVAPFIVLKGIESDIRIDGSLDYEPELLDKLDAVIASVHSKLTMDEAEATARIVKAIENPHTTILGHPTGRILLGRPGYALDIERVFDACVANGVAVEINANCHRLDLDWRHIRRGKDRGVKFIIGPDAHGIEELDYDRYGVGIARKGWLGPEDVLNCMSAKEFLKWAKK